MSLLANIGFIGLMIGLRGLWQSEPGLLFCALFWSVAVLYDFWFIVAATKYQTLPRVVSVVGGLSNAIVTLANGGYMPVTDIEESHSLWVVADNTHVLMPLADIYAGWSIGDFFILGGMALAAIIGIIKMVAGVEEARATA